MNYLNSQKVSIITVCLNSSATIEQTINSVLQQSYKNIEYIVIDGASTDSTLSIISRYKNNIAFLISETDHGLYDAMNKGLGIATGDIIAFINSDDFFTSNSVIEDVVAQFNLYKNIDVVYGNLIIVDKLKTDFVYRFYESSRFKPWMLRFGIMPPHPATFIKKNSYKKIGPYSLSYKIASDFEFFIRLFLVFGCNYQHLNTVLVTMRIGGISTSGLKATILLNNEIVTACRKNGIYTNIFLVLLKIPFKLLQKIKVKKVI